MHPTTYLVGYVIQKRTSLALQFEKILSNNADTNHDSTTLFSVHLLVDARISNCYSPQIMINGCNLFVYLLFHDRLKT